MKQGGSKMSIYDGYPLSVQQAWQERRNQGKHRELNLSVQFGKQKSGFNRPNNLPPKIEVNFSQPEKTEEVIAS